MAIIGIEADMQNMRQAVTERAGGAARRPGSGKAHIRNLLAQQQGNQDVNYARLVQQLQDKVLYSPILGNAKDLVPISELQKLGLSGAPTKAGMPYGIAPSSITPEDEAAINELMQIAQQRMRGVR